MDQVYIELVSQWSTMVGATNFDNKENDSQGHGSPNAQQGKKKPKPQVERNYKRKPQLNETVEV